jgi:hypothetical protein
MIFESLLRVQAMIACPTVLVERSLLDEVDGFDESLAFCEDFDLWLRLSRRAAVRALPEPLADVRAHAGNTSRWYRRELLESLVAVYERASTWTDDARVRTYCRGRCAVFLVELADVEFVSRRYLDACRRLAAALRLRPLRVRPWIALAKGAARPITPPVVLAWYRARRTRASAAR